MTDDKIVPLPPRIAPTHEPFVPEPAVFPYGDAEWAADNLPVVRQAVALLGMRPDQVKVYVAMIAGTAEPSADVLAELNRVAGHLRSLAEACEAAAGRLEWAIAQDD